MLKFIICFTLTITSIAFITIPINNINNLIYTALIEIGTPPQTFEIVLDTGSSNLWVVDTNCGLDQTVCKGHNYFNTTISSTFTDLKKSLNLAYGSGKTSCKLVSDIVNFGGEVVTEFDFGICDQVGFKQFAYSGYDGILGLGFQSIAKDNVPPLFKILINEDNINPGVFSLYLTKYSSGNELILGGIDNTKNASDFTYINLLHKSYWLVGLDQFSFGDEPFLTDSSTAILDSGTSYITLPPTIYQQVQEYLPSSKLYACNLANNLPALIFTLNGTDFEIPGPGYSIEVGNGNCMAAIQGLDFSNENVGFILGDVFLRNYYVAFDYTNSRVGISVANQVEYA